jgi:hypothetical protein
MVTRVPPWSKLERERENKIRASFGSKTFEF